MVDKASLQALIEADPAAAQKLLQDVQQYVVHPHAAQQEVLDSPARFLVLNAGRRLGKSKCGAKKALTVAREGNKMVWWTAPTYKIVKRGYREVLRQLPPESLKTAPPPDTNFDAGRSVILQFKNGSRMEFYSAERPEGMLGEAVDFVVLDEAAIMPGRIWNQIVSPTLMDRKGGALMISTPRGRNWFYKAWLNGQDDTKADWASWTFTSADNPFLPDGEMERMQADLPALEYDQEVLAKFVAAGSSVFLIDDNVIQFGDILSNGLITNEEPQGHVVLGIDLAKTTDFTVMYGANVFNRRNCYFERLNEVSWTEQRRRIRRAVNRLIKNGATGVTLVMDSTGVGDPVVEAMEVAGYDVVPINFTTHKANMVKLFANDLEDGQAIVLSDAELNEFEDYAMSQTKTGKMSYGAPMGGHDDVVSAKILQHWGLVNEGVPAVQIVSPTDPQTESENEASDPSDEYGDLIDDTDTQLQAAEAIGLLTKPPTTRELLLREDVWL